MFAQSEPPSWLITPSVKTSQIAYVELPTPMKSMMYRKNIESKRYQVMPIATRNTSVTNAMLIVELSVHCTRRETYMSSDTILSL
jgi:hypothetical protein